MLASNNLGKQTRKENENKPKERSNLQNIQEGGRGVRGNFLLRKEKIPRKAFSIHQEKLSRLEGLYTLSFISCFTRQKKQQKQQQH